MASTDFCYQLEMDLFKNKMLMKKSKYHPGDPAWHSHGHMSSASFTDEQPEHRSLSHNVTPQNSLEHLEGHDSFLSPSSEATCADRVSILS